MQFPDELENTGKECKAQHKKVDCHNYDDQASEEPAQGFPKGVLSHEISECNLCIEI
jgi:hypothetical protein